jgi:hypothetical protein
MIIGFGHEARAGKDTAAMPLVDLGYKKVGFADALKALAFEADPLIRSGATVNVNIGHGRLKHIVSQLGWERAKDDVPEVRRFLQDLGVAARTVFGEDFWIEQWQATASGRHPDGDVYNDTVVCDVRFGNEFARLRDIGAVLVKIERPGYGATNSSHISERDLVDAVWDHTIVNDGSIEDLHKKVTALHQSLVTAEPAQPATKAA